MRRPAFWLAFAVFSIVSAVVAVRYFPRAFSIVALDITMDREQALAQARDVMARESLGPAGYRQAASFTLDSEAQTFIELEGGGKDAFTAMLQQRPLLRLHLAGPAVQGGRDSRDHDQVHAGRQAVRLRREAEGGRARGGARRQRRARARRGCGAALERRPLDVRRRRAGPGAPRRRARRSHHHLRAQRRLRRRRRLSRCAWWCPATG